MHISILSTLELVDTARYCWSGAIINVLKTSTKHISVIWWHCQFWHKALLTIINDSSGYKPHFGLVASLFDDGLSQHHFGTCFFANWGSPCKTLPCEFAGNVCLFFIQQDVDTSEATLVVMDKQETLDFITENSRDFEGFKKSNKCGHHVII